VKYFLYTLSFLALFSCGQTSDNTPSSKIRTGPWNLSFKISDSSQTDVIPARMEVDSMGIFTLVNGEERIQLKHTTGRGDTLIARIEPYLSSLHYIIKNSDSIEGYWEDEARENYKIPFTAAAAKTTVSNGSDFKDKTYDVTFSYDCPDCAYKAVGVFHSDKGNMTGTFMTETGDYRYLQGESRGDGSFYLSCFDGAHLFYFSGEMKSDSIVSGKFNSGKHHSEVWNARLDANAQLRDPDSLTYLNDGVEELAFKVRNINGDSVLFNKEKLKGKVSVVQIFGSWCPNCTDETKFWRQVAAEFGNDVAIIPVAFERGAEFSKQAKAVAHYKKQFDLPYEVYIGGELSKDKAAQVFSGLNAIMSYPTSIIIDKEGKVRKIHTGFYGPSTGKYHTLYTERLRREIENLLQ
jgi:thiol-disulfide isomerase/thioredoxin